LAKNPLVSTILHFPQPLQRNNPDYVPTARPLRAVRKVAIGTSCFAW